MCSHLCPSADIPTDVELLVEGFHDLHLQDQLGPTREAIGTVFAAGSTSLFRAFDGVRSEVSNRLRERDAQQVDTAAEPNSATKGTSVATTADSASSPMSALPDIRSTIGGFGSFFGSKIASIHQAVSNPRSSSAAPDLQPKTGLRPLNLSAAASPPKKARDNRPASSSSNA